MSSAWPSIWTSRSVSSCSRPALVAERAQQRDRLGGDPRGLDDDAGHVAHLRLELGDLVQRDRLGGLVHLVDRIVHHADQVGDRAAVERRDEDAAHVLQHVARDVVGLMLAVDDLGDRDRAIGPRRAAAGRARRRRRPGSRHAPRTVRRTVPASASAPGTSPASEFSFSHSCARRARHVARATPGSAARGKPAISAFSSGSSTAAAASSKRKPAGVALIPLGPVVDLLDERERKDGDDHVAVAAGAAAFAIGEAADRRRGRGCRGCRLPHRPPARRPRGWRARDRIALGHHPAAGIARGDQHHARMAGLVDHIGKCADLLDGPGPRTRRIAGKDGSLYPVFTQG